jgi:single-strand DNA-binding protein
LRKGSQVYIEGRLKPNKYKDRNGVETFKPVLVADTIQFLDARGDSPGGMGEDEPVVTSARPPRLSQPSPPPRKPTPAPTYNDDPMEEPGFDNRGPNDSEIPF